MTQKKVQEPVFEIYPDVEEGLRALEGYATTLEQLSISPEPARTIREAIAALKEDPSSSIMFGLDPAPDGLKRIIVVGNAAKDHDSIRRGLQAMIGAPVMPVGQSRTLH